MLILRIKTYIYPFLFLIRLFSYQSVIASERKLNFSFNKAFKRVFFTSLRCTPLLPIGYSIYKNIRELMSLRKAPEKYTYIEGKDKEGRDLKFRIPPSVIEKNFSLINYFILKKYLALRNLNDYIELGKILDKNNIPREKINFFFFKKALTVGDHKLGQAVILADDIGKISQGLSPNFAHELGHVKNRDSFFTPLYTLVANVVSVPLYWKVNRMSQVVSKSKVVQFALSLPLLFIPKIVNILYRRKCEKRADLFAAETLGSALFQINKFSKSQAKNIMIKENSSCRKNYGKDYEFAKFVKICIKKDGNYKFLCDPEHPNHSDRILYLQEWQKRRDEILKNFD